MEQAYQQFETKDLINQVRQGKELAKQLQIHLNAPTSAHETREYLAHKIIVSFDKILSMLNSGISIITGYERVAGGREVRVTESPTSFSGSPHSEDSDQDFRSSDSKSDASRKRKAMPRWTKRVKVQPGTGIEGSLDDKYNWRKYGQKDILGAKHPRGYYRCTHRHAQGCLATKQVQRSDNDPTLFEITYRGRHTCTDQSSNSSPPPLERSNPSTSLAANVHDHQLQNHQQNSQEVLLNFKNDLKVITEDLDSHDQTHIPTSFYFPSTSNNNINNTSENYSLSHFYMLGENNIASPSFGSPATSGSNYNLSVSPSNMSNFGGNFQALQASGNELNEIISAATSVTNSPTIGLNYQFGGVEFNSNFTFDNSGFFS
ncbi:putative WRKY transcription factor 30 [Apium graveolens]|uniref:putative WRKY transcription factor 30 n=1 Tax=Apium graveolens TaxID=4045 RepID=UPI003D7972A9